MVQWEYQVIRLNVEPPVASAPAAEAAPPPPAPSSGAGSAGSGPATPKPAFSEAYLRQEFPRYYDSSPSQAQPQGQGQPRPEDPGAQLQAFFNGHGQQGWELVGFQHAAPHVFIVFKRPKEGGSDAEQHGVLAAQQEQLRLTLDLANRALAIIEKQA